MSVPPPPGYGIASVTFQRAGTPHPMVCTMGFQNTGAANAPTNVFRWRDALTGNNTRPFAAVNMIAGWNITETYVLQVSVGGVPTSAVNTTAIAGSRVASGMPVNTSIVVNKSVAVVGRQYRGRMLWPPTYLDKSVIDQDGIIVAGSVTTMAAFATALITKMQTDGIPPYLLHQPPLGGGSPPAPTAISGMTVRNRIGTIRHRIRR